MSWYLYAGIAWGACAVFLLGSMTVDKFLKAGRETGEGEE